MSEQLTEKELDYMFHSLGYDFNPKWYDNRGGYRNHFATSSEDPIISSLVEKGFMYFIQKQFEMSFYGVTEKGIELVKKLWEEKKKKNKPSRSKRRYDAYLDWTDIYNGTFKDFLNWLKITPEMRVLYPEECEMIEDFKKRWGI